MNIVDKNFKEFVLEIKNNSYFQILDTIKNGYLNIPDETKDSIEEFLKRFPYWGKLERRNLDFEELRNRAKSIKEHIDDYVWLYDKLKDYRSKKLLFGILNNWYKSDFYNLDAAIDKYHNHYFDLDIIPNCYDSVFVDVGAYTGDTTLDFIGNYGDGYKKIYCYEITDNIVDILKRNTNGYHDIVIKNKALSDKSGYLYFNKSDADDSANCVMDGGDKKIECVSLDEDIKEKISILKMDIEGHEEYALMGALNHIRNDEPILLISVYHNHEDLYKIPLMIDEMNNNYDFYLRCYGNCIFPTEIVLIAKKHE